MVSVALGCEHQTGRCKPTHPQLSDCCTIKDIDKIVYPHIMIQSYDHEDSNVFVRVGNEEKRLDQF